MDIGRIPIIAPVPSGDTNVTSRGTQATDLPQFQTVQRTASSDSVSLTFREVPAPQPNEAREEPSFDQVEAFDSVALQNREREIRREFERDRETAALIFKSIDVSTGEVVQQYPEEARLNLRAYLGSKEEARVTE
ncbi:MAG: hypothetical protein ABJN04_13570 [Hyphomicrobiales bacterium]